MVRHPVRRRKSRASASLQASVPPPAPVPTMTKSTCLVLVVLRASASSRRDGTHRVLARSRAASRGRPRSRFATATSDTAILPSRGRFDVAVLGFGRLPGIALVEIHAHIAARTCRAAPADLAPGGRMGVVGVNDVVCHALFERTRPHGMPPQAASLQLALLHAPSSASCARHRASWKRCAKARSRLLHRARRARAARLRPLRHARRCDSRPITAAVQSSRRPAPRRERRPRLPAAARSRSQSARRVATPSAVKKCGSPGRSRAGASITSRVLLIPGGREAFGKHVVAGVSGHASARCIGGLPSAERGEPGERETGKAGRCREGRSIEEILAPVAPAAHVRARRRRHETRRPAKPITAVSRSHQRVNQRSRPSAQRRSAIAAGCDRGQRDRQEHERIVEGAAEMQQPGFAASSQEARRADTGSHGAAGRTRNAAARRPARVAHALGSKSQAGPTAAWPWGADAERRRTSSAS